MKSPNQSYQTIETSYRKRKLDITSNVLDRSPIRPHVDSIHEMKNSDLKRYHTYKNYSQLHEFTTLEGNQNASLEDRVDERLAKMTKKAMEVKQWPDQKKIETFAKYE